MEIHKLLIFGRFLSRFIEKIYHRLIVAVHKIDLIPLHPHGRVGRKDFIHLLAKRCPTGPKYDVHPLGLGMVYNSRQVNFGDNLKQIGTFRPAFVQNPILDAELSGEINVMFVSLGIDACLKTPPRNVQSFHQSQATLPGLIHEVSAIREGAAKRYTRSLLSSSASSPETAKTRQG